MAAYLTLKSTVSEIADYRAEDLTPFLPDFTLDKAQLKRDIDRLRAAHGRRFEADRVASGDLVLLSSVSEEPRFRKRQLAVPVGRGLFHPELEGKLIGLPAGEAASLTADGVPVSVHILRITRTEPSPLTDEAVAAWGMEGVTDVKSLRRYCVDRQLDRFLDENEDADMAAAVAAREAAAKSVVRLDEGEQAFVLRSVQERLAELPPEDADGIPPEQAQELFQGIFLDGLKAAAIGCALAAERGSLRTEEDYREALRRWMDSGLTEAEARERCPVLRYLIDWYGELYSQEIDAYVRGQFKQALNPYAR